MRRRELLAGGAAAVFGAFVPKHSQAGPFGRRRGRDCAANSNVVAACPALYADSSVGCVTCPLYYTMAMCTDPGNPATCIATYYCLRCCPGQPPQPVPWTSSDLTICNTPGACGACGTGSGSLPSACFSTMSSTMYRHSDPFCASGFPAYLTGMPQFNRDFTDSGIHRFQRNGQSHTVWWFQFERGSKALRTGYEIRNSEHAPLVCSFQQVDGYCYKLYVDRSPFSAPVHVTLVGPGGSKG